VFFGSVVLLPLWLQTQMGYTATEAGFILAPVGILALVMSPIVGRTITRIDPRITASAAFVLFAVVSYLRSRFNTQVDLFTLMVPTIVQGAAVACFFIPLVSITLAGLPPDRIASASGLSNFLRITAGALGTSISTTIWDDRATLHHAHLAEAVNQGNSAAAQALAQLQAAGMSASQALASLDRILWQQAYVLSADDVFYASAIIFVVLLPLVWLAKRPRRAADAGGAH
jgi:DHA2 family multidrug resistance protein